MKTQTILTIVLAAIICYLVYLVLAPFFMPIFWAAVFVVIFYPYYRWLIKNVAKNPSIASILACISIAVFLITPMAIIGSTIATELLTVYQWAEGYIKDISSKAHNSHIFIIPYVSAFIKQYIAVSTADLNSIFLNAIKEVASFSAIGVTGFIKNSVEFVFNLVMAFFTMFYLFREGDALIAFIKRLLPLPDTHKDRIFARTRVVITSSVNGGLLVGGIQGILGGAAFWTLGLPAPVLWGFAMFILSFLPGIGSALVWGPAAIYLFVTGEHLYAAALVIGGCLAIGLIDYLLRPLIMGNKTGLHPLLLFFSIIGAVNVFGLIGIIAGPVILSIGGAMIEIYQESLRG
ncbi:MAG: AI-2E family transporter [Deltaproteobacteria bacterium]|nr:AI-2E family transporter [Deltaproteobacteria bacterium]